jgi:hypothetical protein
MAGVQIDGVNNKIDFDDDQDTSISANTDDTLVIEAGGNTMATITATTFTINDGTTITTADNTDTLTLKSTDADADEGPILKLHRDSGSPADGDIIGEIRFNADNDAGEDTECLHFKAQLADASDGSEDGQIYLIAKKDGTDRNRFAVKSDETIFNEDSVDVDFRVESNGQTHMIHVDAGNDHVNIAGGGTDGGGVFNVFSADNTTTLSLVGTDSDASAGPILSLERSANSAATGDEIGKILFKAQNAANETIEYCEIRTDINDATDGSEDGRFIIQTIDAGSAGRSRMEIVGTETIFNQDSADIDFRVESNNNINMIKVDAGDDRTHYGGTSYQGQNLGVHNFHSGTTTDQSGLQLGSNTASYANALFKIGCLRDQTNSYNFVECYTGNGSDNINDDLEFKVKGDGNVSCDESFTGSGADYAEYFEWKDGNASDEDRIGISVKLDGNKIVPSSDSDNASDIIGVVSGSPVIVGDADGTGARWTQKYLKDDYGRKLKEEYTVTTWRDEANKQDHSYATDRIPSDVTVPSDAKVTTTELDGVTKLLRPKINPDYDKTKTYVSREDRKEWDTVGLVGKLRIKKGQKTGTNWIKMRDISDSVEEWLVR